MEVNFINFTKSRMTDEEPHRTIPSAVSRRQIFRQMCQKAQRILCGFASMVGASDGKDASKTVLKASAVNCAVLP